MRGAIVERGGGGQERGGKKINVNHARLSQAPTITTMCKLSGGKRQKPFAHFANFVADAILWH